MGYVGATVIAANRMHIMQQGTQPYLNSTVKHRPAAVHACFILSNQLLTEAYSGAHNEGDKQTCAEFAEANSDEARSARQSC